MAFRSSQLEMNDDPLSTFACLCKFTKKLKKIKDFKEYLKLWKSINFGAKRTLHKGKAQNIKLIYFCWRC